MGDKCGPVDATRISCSSLSFVSLVLHDNAASAPLLLATTAGVDWG